MILVRTAVRVGEGRDANAFKEDWRKKDSLEAESRARQFGNIHR